jgi:CheY-like chemotaxis protein
MKTLIVEDTESMRKVLGYLLRKLPDMETIETCDGLEAWKLLEGGLRPDLALVDIAMPIMDGLELVQRVRFHPQLRTLKIIICSAVKERHRLAEAHSLEISGYLTKPFTSANVYTEVKKALGLPDSLKPAA